MARFLSSILGPLEHQMTTPPNFCWSGRADCVHVQIRSSLRRAAQRHVSSRHEIAISFSHSMAGYHRLLDWFAGAGA